MVVPFKNLQRKKTLAKQLESPTRFQPLLACCSLAVSVCLPACLPECLHACLYACLHPTPFIFSSLALSSLSLPLLSTFLSLFRLSASLSHTCVCVSSQAALTSLPPRTYPRLIDWRFVRAASCDDSAVAPSGPSPLYLQAETVGGGRGYPCN